MTTKEAVNEGGLVICTEGLGNVVHHDYVLYIQSQGRRNSGHVNTLREHIFTGAV